MDEFGGGDFYLEVVAACARCIDIEALGLESLSPERGAIGMFLKDIGMHINAPRPSWDQNGPW